ncbi:hypothetical protein IWX90DRAFT_411989 [Phyllosticta citrichinensis]|uniref:Uncharacterized protein n=1 Tax=Phyllosticta citrichinensis TaxID=1130410 RepID=A0ABR1Y2Q4_9PEZI
MDATHRSDQAQLPSNILSNSSAQSSSEFAQKVDKLKLRLCPLYPMPCGPPHPDFPKSLLHFWLLNEEQLDNIAAYYHQTTANQWTELYPCPMHWDVEFLADPALSPEDRLAIKRRKIGKFIGLRGCDTPIEESKKQVDFAIARIEKQVEMEREAARAAEKGWMRWYGV